MLMPTRVIVVHARRRAGRQVDAADERIDLAAHPLRFARQLLTGRQAVERHREDGIERLGVAGRPADIERVAEAQIDFPFDEVLGPFVLEPAGHDGGELDLLRDDVEPGDRSRHSA